eukprot:5192462-Amphidinium_carterae.2
MPNKFCGVCGGGGGITAGRGDSSISCLGVCWSEIVLASTAALKAAKGMMSKVLKRQSDSFMEAARHQIPGFQHLQVPLKDPLKPSSRPHQRPLNPPP